MQELLDKVWGEWVIREMIGEGGFGKVYRITREDSFGHEYQAALKIIRIPQTQSDVTSVLFDGMNEENARTYFYSIVEDIVTEIVLMSKLKGYTNIVSYEDHAVIPFDEGIGWTILIRMELLTPLFHYLKDHPISKRDVVQLGIDISRALEVCQEYNIIHRDIKPENIFVSELGNFVLGDFGIAKQLEKSSSMHSKKGTSSYMAPEVFKGEEYNSTVDIYSLGIVMYRFLNNNRIPFLSIEDRPIRFNDTEEANTRRFRGEEIPRPCNDEGRLAEIVLKACSYYSNDRYQNARELREDLEEILLQVENDIIFVYKNFFRDQSTSSAFSDKEVRSEKDKEKDFSDEEIREKENNEKTASIFSGNSNRSNNGNNDRGIQDKANRKKPINKGSYQDRGPESGGKKNKLIIGLLFGGGILVAIISCIIFFANPQPEPPGPAHTSTKSSSTTGTTKMKKPEEPSTEADILQTAKDNSIESVTYPVEFQGHAYALFDYYELEDDIDSFDDCNEYCNKLGGHLIVINSEGENDFITDYLSDNGYDYALLGFTDQDEEGEWEWVDGYTSSYTNWADDQPNNKNGNENYAQIDSKTLNGEWIDASFKEGSHRFLCEWE